MLKRLYALALCAALVVLSGCSAENFNHIYNSDDAIANADSQLALLSLTNHDGDELTMKSTMTGCKTVWSYSADESCEVTVSAMLSVSAGGKAKLVLVTPDDEVVPLLENTDNTVADEMEEITLPLEPGKNRLKVVGFDSPELELKLSVDTGTLGTED